MISIKNTVAHQPDINDGEETYIQLDALIVGGGFGGCYLLHKLRQQGLKTKLVEGLDGFGGVWRANWYPGARVDSEMPFYMFSAPELVDSWTWTERFPSAIELRKYFDHVDRIWKLSQDAFFNTRVLEARYEESIQRWHIKTSDNSLRFSCRWFLPAVGTTHKQHVPEWPGLSSFKGELYHTAAWPHQSPEAVMKGKKMAVIGAGSSGLQVVQEAAKQASHLTQFIRTPTLATAMQQRPVSEIEVEQVRSTIQPLVKWAKTLSSGLPYVQDGRKTIEVSPDEREILWTSKWKGGGWKFTAEGFGDLLLDKEANTLAYDFWRRQVLNRVSDPIKREILAPQVAPYFISTKRPCMEQDYYEMMSLPHVDVTNSPIKSFDETGIITEDGKHHTFDLIAVATGYDAVTGGFTSIDIQGRNGTSLRDKWAEGVRTFLGMSVHGFPNMFITYGPQAPTSLANGPLFIEDQVDWICNMIAKADIGNLHGIEATESAEEEWRNLVLGIADQTLLPLTDSWWMGSNIPGKKKEILIFLGGMGMYSERCAEAYEGMKGFEYQSGAGQLVS